MKICQEELEYACAVLEMAGNGQFIVSNDFCLTVLFYVMLSNRLRKVTSSIML